MGLAIAADYAGSTDYYTQDSLCWPDRQCFTDDTPTHEPVSGWDLHRDRATITNSTLYSTTLYTQEAGRIIAAHARQHLRSDAGPAAARPLFLYLPYQAVRNSFLRWIVSHDVCTYMHVCARAYKPARLPLLQTVRRCTSATSSPPRTRSTAWTKRQRATSSRTSTWPTSSAAT
jgi:hypothetical protein|eukprot:COSAG01_NODE_1301_length_10829_cov_20.185182_7_plen_174_part_00